MSNIVLKHFRTAKKSAFVVSVVQKVLNGRKFDKTNTLFAQSVCSDEINFEPNDITSEMDKTFGKVFQLGGLAGIPFTGKTVFSAFSHHVPDKPSCMFILFAPHIGVSKDGNHLGQYDRDGMKKANSACGAAVGALQHCKDGLPIPVPGVDPFNFQMDYIISEVNKRYAAIDNQPDENAQQATLAYSLYDIAKDYLEHIIHLEAHTTLFLLGGVQINIPSTTEGVNNDMFMPLLFEQRHIGGRVDLMSAFVEDSTTPNTGATATTEQTGGDVSSGH